MSALHRNNVNVTGSGGTPMVFAHGYGCDQHMWRLVAPAFEATHRVILFDHVGSGGADVTAYNRMTYSSLNGYAADVIAICDELEVRDGIFVGHSVSAMIGILAAIARPDLFERLVLIGPSPRYIDDDGYIGGFTKADIEELLALQDSNYLGWSRTMAPVIMGNAQQPILKQELTDSFCRTDPLIARHFAAVTFMSDNRADLPLCRVRSLILQCRDDAIAPVAVGEYMERHLPDATMTLLNATGHCPHLSAPDPTIAAIRTFLDEQ